MSNKEVFSPKDVIPIYDMLDGGYYPDTKEGLLAFVGLQKLQSYKRYWESLYSENKQQLDITDLYIRSFEEVSHEAFDATTHSIITARVNEFKKERVRLERNAELFRERAEYLTQILSEATTKG